MLGMSALLTTTMPYMKVVIDTLKEKGMRDDYIVLVGGAPLNEEFANADRRRRLLPRRRGGGGDGQGLHGQAPRLARRDDRREYSRPAGRQGRPSLQTAWLPKGPAFGQGGRGAEPEATVVSRLIAFSVGIVGSRTLAY